MKVVLPFLALAMGVAGVMVLFATAPEIVEKPLEVAVPVVAVAEVAPQRYTLRVRSQGTVSARTESDLVPQVAGQVVSRSPQLVSGGFFAEGDTLLEIETIDYEVALERARAALSRAESEQVRARKELDRLRGLAGRGVASEAQLDDAERAASVAVAGVREARALVSQAERDLARTTLRAPFSGRVRRAAVDVGQFVSRGVPVATLYATDRAEVRLPVADEELAFLVLPDWSAVATGVHNGPTVHLRTRFAGAEQTWPARLVRTEGEIDARSRMVHVVAEVDDPYGADGAGVAPLAVGLFVEAEIVGREVEDVVVAPRAAMRDQEHIVVVDAEDRLRLRRTAIVRRERHHVILEAATFEPGDRIVITALEAAVEGSRVRPVAADGNGNGAASPRAGR